MAKSVLMGGLAGKMGLQKLPTGMQFTTRALAGTPSAAGAGREAAAAQGRKAAQRATSPARTAGGRESDWVDVLRSLGPWASTTPSPAEVPEAWSSLYETTRPAVTGAVRSPEMTELSERLKGIMSVEGMESMRSRLYGESTGALRSQEKLAMQRLQDVAGNVPAATARRLARDLRESFTTQHAGLPGKIEEQVQSLFLGALGPAAGLATRPSELETGLLQSLLGVMPHLTMTPDFIQSLQEKLQQTVTQPSAAPPVFGSTAKTTGPTGRHRFIGAHL